MMIRAVISAISEYKMFNRGDIILCGISGGADSMAMLHILRELSEKYGVDIRAGHFNHRLRGEESDRDEEFVRSYCMANKIKFYSGGADVLSEAAGLKKGIEETARDMRYSFFDNIADEIGAARIATAHTATDNAETVIMNLMRGAGARGLCGIPPVRGRIIRPLFKCTRRDIEGYLKEHSVPHTEDITNADTAYRRNAVRHNIIPVMKKLSPDLDEKLIKTSALLRYDCEYLDSAAEHELECINKAEIPLKFNASRLISMHRAISARVIKKLINTAGGPISPSFSDIQNVLELAGSDNPSGMVKLSGGLTALRVYEDIIFSYAGEDNIYEITPQEINLSGVTDIKGTKYEVFVRAANNFDIISNSVDTFYVKCDRIFGKVVFRSKMTGDRIKLCGCSGTKTLKKLFIDKKIPRLQRPCVPVIADEGGVIAVYGLGADIKRAATGLENTFRIEIREKIYEYDR